MVLMQPRYIEAISLLYYTRTTFLESPILLHRLHHRLHTDFFNSIRRLELVLCSNYAAPITEVNIQAFSTFKGILKGMKLLQYLRIVLPCLCWRDLLHKYYSWAELEHHLSWLKELRGTIEVAVMSFELAGLLPKPLPAKTAASRRLEAGHFVLVE